MHQLMQMQACQDQRHNSSTDKGALFSEAQSYVKDHHYSENLDLVERAVKDQSYRTNNEESNRLTESMSASFDKSRSYRDEMNSSFSQAESARSNASLAQDNARSINANANQNFMEWMSNQPGTNGQGKMGLHQAETLMKDPNMQLYYARQYSEQFKPQFESNWNHGMAHTKTQIETQHQSNNRHITKAASVHAYRSGSHAIHERSSHQGLVPEKFIDNSARSNTEGSLKNSQSRIDKEHIEILDGGANQKHKVNTEQSRIRHGGLTSDLIHDVDTKDYQKERA